MKKISFILMLGIAVAAMAATAPISWKSTQLKLGQVKANVAIPLTFEFTNVSDKPVTVLEAKGSCGCTSVKFPQDAIAPGKSATITASFRSGKVGTFKKNIRIRTDQSEAYTYLYFTGEVVH
ncbi:DUF1573 domain-containing protein [Marinoscillum furvescens]|uniref:Uncharacterized protein DUF1573 n=1 Tax=Marinoscillum furvescens DSM 4134 TaxID=1122208 RepID=A0A3D9L3G0_MARFU|nr:DUF1573 domain-containing protein [Marinoscillum furvescens]RED98820.1 uncharacterized protein DUF1573 [Marinoscillum furvescens DSM 4134]